MHPKHPKLPVFVRHRLDISVQDLLFGLKACVRPGRRKEVIGDVLQTCSARENGLVCLSVRTGFDLLIGALDWPAETEIIVSAITHPHMARILRAHGLHPVPVDVNPETLAPSPAALEAALTPRTKAVLVAHLFGGEIDLQPISNFTREYGLLLFEDCAQSFRGPALKVTPADASMYSFGPLKTATALGGAVLRIKNTIVLEKTRYTEKKYPSQGRVEYAFRLLKYLALGLASRPIPYGSLVRVCRGFGVDLDDLPGSTSGSFPSSSEREFFDHLRRRPPLPLLALLVRRLRRFDHERLARRASAGEWVSKLLEPYVTVPGSRSRQRTHWLLPVVSAHPETLVSTLRNNGFDASYATSNLTALKTPPGLPFPHEAHRVMSSIVYLPVYPELRQEKLEHLAKVVVGVEG